MAAAVLLQHEGYFLDGRWSSSFQ